MKGFPLKLLGDYHIESKYTNRDFAKSMADELSENLTAFKVGAVIKDIHMTPFAIMFDVVPDVGVSVKKFKDLRVDLEVRLGAPVEIENYGDQQYTIKIAMKNWSRPIVGLKSILESKEFNDSEYILPIAAGMDVMGRPFVFDLAETPHLLVAGCTGSGKSTFLNDLILSILYSKPSSEVKMVMIDPKGVELVTYNGIPYLYGPVVTSLEQAIDSLNMIADMMNKRYQMFSKVTARDIDSYNARVPEKDRVPRIVIIVDEYMDMMLNNPKDVEASVGTIARMGRAAGIHLVLSTQRPSTDIVTGQIKANIPCRASFTVVDKRESKIIIDRTGAERLMGNGDMIYSATDIAIPVHAQAAYVSYKEVDSVIDFVRLNHV